jgi:hypothetical protein
LIQVTPLHTLPQKIGLPKDPANHPRTPFSFQRFLIPQACGFQGRAIYLDSDMQVFRDIRSLWTLPMDQAPLLTTRSSDPSTRRPQFSVMLMDCEKLAWNINDFIAAMDVGALNYTSLVHEMKPAGAYQDSIESGWNSLESFDPKGTSLVHYTDMNTQPWISRKNRIGALWCQDLFEAVDAGFIGRQTVAENVEKGWVRPSLLFQVDHRISDPRRLPRAACLLDKNYQAPYLGLLPSTPSPGPSRGILSRFRSLVGTVYRAVQG